MTEDEAKQHWCPLARAVRGDGVSGFNRGTDMKPDVATFCIASACMAWRWSRAKETRGFLAAVRAHMALTGDNFNKSLEAVWKEHGDSFEHTEGYCGAFGKEE